MKKGLFYFCSPPLGKIRNVTRKIRKVIWKIRKEHPENRKAYPENQESSSVKLGKLIQKFRKVEPQKKRFPTGKNTFSYYASVGRRCALKCDVFSLLSLSISSVTLWCHSLVSLSSVSFWCHSKGDSSDINQHRLASTIISHYQSASVTINSHQ